MTLAAGWWPCLGWPGHRASLCQAGHWILTGHWAQGALGAQYLEAQKANWRCGDKEIVQNLCPGSPVPAKGAVQSASLHVALGWGLLA